VADDAKRPPAADFFQKTSIQVDTCLLMGRCCHAVNAKENGLQQPVE